MPEDVRHLGEKRHATATVEQKKESLERDYSRYAFSYSTDTYTHIIKPGLRREVVEEISSIKNEPAWMREFRLQAYEVFLKKPMPTWGGDLSKINFDAITYYASPTDKGSRSWDDVPEEVKKTFDRLGIPEAERKFLAGVGAQYDSEVVYHSIREDLAKKGVIFLGMDDGLRQYPEIVKEYFGTVIPKEDNKFAALNSAAWSGGSFIYVPKGVEVDIPLQAYFRINSANMGQFERTLIIADEGARVHYIEGCTAPVYSRESLHSAVVELIAKKGAHLRYTTLQNWSNDVYNLVTKRAVAYEDATVEWVDANIGCLTADTKVFLNPRGAVNIRDVKPNDWVYALDLNSMQTVKRRVSGVVETGIKPVFKLTTENFREIKATANHPFLALGRPAFSKQWQLTWKPLEALEPGDYIALTQGLPDEGKSHSIDYQPVLTKTKIRPRIPQETSEDLMWLLGCYLGDGYLERVKNGAMRRVYFAVPESDSARPKLISLLQSIFGLNWKPKGICVTVSSAILAEFFVHLGLAGTAHEKSIPRWVFRLPRRQKLAFIEGYLAADGHVRQRTGKDGKLYGQITFASCNRALLEDLKLLMISCGLNPLKISSYSRERVLLNQYKGVYTTHYLNLPLRDLERIRHKPATQAGVEFVRILSVEPLGEEAVYDIEVEGAHNFVANGLVVHNSRLTMKYPSVYMVGKGAKADILSVAYAGKGQHQDTGGKAIHAAPYTTSTIVAKSVSKDGGRAAYRGQLVVANGAHHAKSNVRCDALLLDEHSRSDTYPYIEIDEDQVTIGHEATVGKVGDDQIFYLQSRGLSESEALSLIVLGFMEPFTKTLPMEYAIEFNRLIQLEMEGSVG